MLISKFGSVAIDEEIKEYEHYIGHMLPEQLSVFLKKYNGGETPETSFYCNQISSDIKAFYGLGTVKFSYNEVEPLMCNQKKYLPIALDSFGNDIIIAIDSGQIFFKNHETDEIVFLANDLKEFIRSCKSEYINLTTIKSIQEREQDLIRNGRGNIITDMLRGLWQEEIDKYSSMIQEDVKF